MKPSAFADEVEQRRSDESARTGAACCPNNGCWNGYACVTEFTTSSLLVEKTGESNDFRCTAGEWVQDPVKYVFVPQLLNTPLK